MLGSLIGAAGSVLGGLLGGEEKTKGKNKTWTNASTRSKVHLTRLVNEAERAGFNPLTILRAGGLSAYTDTFSRSFSKSKTKGSSSSSSPLGAGIAAAANTLGGAITNANDPAATAQAAWQAPSIGAKAAEFDVVQQQLKGVNPGELATQPRVPASTTYEAKKPALGGYSSGQDGGAMQPTFEAPTVTNPFPKSWGVKVDPSVPDAQAFEDRYGGSEIAEMIGGLTVAGADAWQGVRSGYQHFVDKDLPAMRKRSAELMDTVSDAGAFWHPPALSQYAPVVVRKTPLPLLTNGGGAW